MLSCNSCQKIYPTPQKLDKHYKRQPLCEKWIELQNGALKEFVDYKIKIQRENELDYKETNTTCLCCKTIFSNVGNLNRHLSINIVCSKWNLYNDLQPINGFLGKIYNEFEAPKYSLNHIIWNIYLIDKEFAKKEDAIQILNENKCKYIIAILPTSNNSTPIEEEIQNEKILQSFDLEYNILGYQGHNTEDINFTDFNNQCIKIEEYRKKRENVFIFCNNGYQRSIPFLTYYLCHYHKDEVPNIEKAIDIILPQIYETNNSYLRNKYIDNMKLIFKN